MLNFPIFNRFRGRKVAKLIKSRQDTNLGFQSSAQNLSEISWRKIPLSKQELDQNCKHRDAKVEVVDTNTLWNGTVSLVTQSTGERA